MDWKSIYELLKEVGALAGLGWLLRTGINAYQRRLTKCDKQLLVAATTGDGFIHLFNYPNLGKPWVRAGSFDLGDSPISQAEFVDSLTRLVENGYAYQANPGLFTLSSKGMRSATTFARWLKFEAIPSQQNSGKTPPPTVGGILG